MRIHALLFLMLCSVSISPAFAQVVEEQEEEPSTQKIMTDNIKKNPDRNYISFSHENDKLGGGTDQFYTSGARLTYFNVNTQVPYFFEQIDDHIPSFDVNSTTSTSYSIGQNIFTPQDIGIDSNQDDDRPWAAFLYGSIGLTTSYNNHIDDVELTLGVVGPEALGEQTQKFIHRHVSDSAIPKGWEHQLDFEPGLIISWQRRWPYSYTYDFGDFSLNAEPNINLSLGNIYTYAGTPPRVRPAVPGTGYFDTPERGWSWYVFAGADGRAVARNIFLDGNTFKDSHSVDKEILVGDLTGGIAFTLGDYRLAYSYNYRTEEFKNQDEASKFGSLTLTYKF